MYGRTPGDGSGGFGATTAVEPAFASLPSRQRAAYPTTSATRIAASFRISLIAPS